MSDYSTPKTQTPIELSGYMNSFNSGNPMLDMFGYAMLGHNAAPRPQGNQSVYDAYLLRERSRRFAEIQQQVFANQGMMKFMGANPNNEMLRTFAKFGGSPNGMAQSVLNQFQGGNPVMSAMSLYSNMTGQTMSSLGMVGTNVSAAQAIRLNDVFQRTLSSPRQLTGDGLVNYQQGLFNAYKDEFGKGGINTGPGVQVGRMGNNLGEYVNFAEKNKQALKDNADLISRFERYSAFGGRVLEGRDKVSVRTKGEDVYDVAGKGLYRTNAFGSGDGEKLFSAQKAVNEALAEAGIAAKNGYVDMTSPEVLEIMNSKKGVKLKESVLKLQDAQIELSGVDEVRAAFAKVGINDIGNNGEKMNAEAMIELSRRIAASHATASDVAISKALEVYGGADHSKLRGFKTHDIATAFSAAADMRLLGEGAGQDINGIEQKAEQFSETAGRMLAALKTIFGDKSAGSLMGELNQLVRGGVINMTDANDVDNFERKAALLKASSRLTGVSMDSSVEDMRRMAESFAGHETLNGQDTSKILLDITSQAQMGSAVGLAHLNNRTVRRLGFGQGIDRITKQSMVNALGSVDYDAFASARAYMEDIGGPAGRLDELFSSAMKEKRTGPGDVYSKIDRIATEMGFTGTQMAGLNAAYRDKRMASRGRGSKAFGDISAEDLSRDTLNAVFRTDGGLESALDAAVARGEDPIAFLMKQTQNGVLRGHMLETEGADLIPALAAKYKDSAMGKTYEKLRLRREHMANFDLSLSKTMAGSMRSVIEKGAEALMGGGGAEDIIKGMFAGQDISKMNKDGITAKLYGVATNNGITDKEASMYALLQYSDPSLAGVNLDDETSWSGYMNNLYKTDPTKWASLRNAKSKNERLSALAGSQIKEENKQFLISQYVGHGTVDKKGVDGSRELLMNELGSYIAGDSQNYDPAASDALYNLQNGGSVEEAVNSLLGTDIVKSEKSSFMTGISANLERHGVGEGEPELDNMTKAMNAFSGKADALDKTLSRIAGILTDGKSQ